MSSHAIYAGTFDPPTLGHLHVLRQATTIFTTVTVLIADNPAKAGQETLPPSWRAGIFRTQGYENVRAKTLPKGQTVARWASQNDANFLVRGVRSGLDLDQELNLAAVNSDLSEGRLHTVLIPAPPSLSYVSSTVVRQLWTLSGNEDTSPLESLSEYVDYLTRACLLAYRQGQPFPFGAEYLE
jgi:pantetheine-phosphate adenylyltransferase